MSNHPWRNQRQVIECCRDCKPPKRYPGCGDHCPDYKAEKTQFRANKKREKEFLKNNRACITEYDFNRISSTASRKRK